MNILFMGTPDFALEAIKALNESKHNIVGAVTQPDKPKGRGHKTVAPPVKEYALEHGIPVFQPETLKNGELNDVLNEYKPDIIVVAAYGKILPNYVIDYPKYGCINIHASLLPKYRGAAPIQHSILNGDEKTGISIMQMDYGLDTGDILLVAETPIKKYETSGELFDRLALIGGESVLVALDIIEDGKAVRVPQGSDFTYASMINKQMGRIDWAKSAGEISCLICAMNPWPMAYTEYKGETMKIIEAVIVDEKYSGECGEVIGYQKGKGLLVKCADTAVAVTKVQFTGGKKMPVEDYMRGHSIESGVVLGKE